MRLPQASARNVRLRPVRFDERPTPARGRCHCPWRSDQGSGSVLVLAVAGVLVVLAVALSLLAQATVARTRAQAVADLAAIGGARAAQAATLTGDTAVDACARARQVAAHNGGRLLACDEATGGVVSVGAAVATVVGDARGTARAGPRR